MIAPDTIPNFSERYSLTKYCPIAARTSLFRYLRTWTGFAREDLIAGIQRNQAKRESSFWRQRIHTVQVWFYRWWFRELWTAFFSRLERASTAHTPEELKSILADPFSIRNKRTFHCSPNDICRVDVHANAIKQFILFARSTGITTSKRNDF